MRAKPDMKPWVRTDKTNQSSARAALSVRAFVLDRVVPPLWGSIYVDWLLTQGLRPGLCRSVALAGLIHIFTTNQLLGCFDAGILGKSLYTILCSNPYGVNSTIELTHSEFSTPKIVFAFPKLKTSAKSVQTTRVVCTNYGWSLYRLQLKSPESTTYLQI